MTFPWLFYHPAEGDPYLQYLVLWMKGTDFVDYSPYNTTITNNSASSDGLAYIGNNSGTFETTDNSGNFVLFNTSFTIMFDLKRQSDSWGAIVGKARLDDSPTASSNSWLVTMATGSYSPYPLSFIIVNPGVGTVSLDSTAAPAADGSYHNYKYTYDGTTLKLWIDGVLDVSMAVTSFTDTTSKLGIMAEDSYPGIPYLGYQSTHTDYNALLKELKIYRGIAIE